MRCHLLWVLGLLACTPAWAKKVDLDYQCACCRRAGRPRCI